MDGTSETEPFFPHCRRESIRKPLSSACAGPGDPLRCVIPLDRGERTASGAQIKIIIDQKLLTADRISCLDVRLTGKRFLKLENCCDELGYMQRDFYRVSLRVLSLL